MATDKPVRFGVAGLGGYAAQIRGVVQRETSVGLAAVCEPDQAAHADTIAELRAAGVAVHETFEALLDEDIEAVWLPVPIDLHEPFTVQALEAGKAVMCEKPAAGTVDELDAMIAARDRAKLPAAVGFQDVYCPTTMPMKRRLLDGEIGRIHSAVVWSTSPRTDQYYARADWAGAFQRRGRWVLDSPAQNGLAHYMNIALFLMGDAPDRSAQPVAVEAELYRAHDIENYDTCALRLTLEAGATLTVLFTHACKTLNLPVVTLHGERGKVVRTIKDVTIESAGRSERMNRPQDPRAEMTRLFARHVRRQAGADDVLASFEVARAHLLAINGSQQAAPVRAVPREQVMIEPYQDAGRSFAIRGIEDAFATCAAGGKLLHEAGLFDWTQPAESLDLRGYNHFAGPAEVSGG